MSTAALLKTEIESRIASLSSSNDAEEILVLTSALDVVTQDRLNSLNTVDDLPAPGSIPEGSIFFVESINTIVFNMTDSWRSLDGRKLRTDPVYALGWGHNVLSKGSLGINSVVDKSSPISVVGGITNWFQVSAGFEHSIAITVDGLAYAWGENDTYGLLGDDTKINRSSPVLVAGGITNWTQVSAGGEHTLGVTSDGIAYAWGNGGDGRLGINSVVAKSSPATIAGGITDWKQVSASQQHSLGVTESGIGYAWGRNASGPLGINSGVIQVSSPVKIAGGITTWSQVSAGALFSLGLTKGGVAYAWGLGSNGQLGTNSSINFSSPVLVAGGITNWSQVSAGHAHALGIANGIAYAWGSNSDGALGTNNITNYSSPVTVVGGITNWSKISAGSKASIGIADAGIAYSWGQAQSGKLGIGIAGVSTFISSPLTVVGGITSWVDIDMSQAEAFTGDQGFTLGLKVG